MGVEELIHNNIEHRIDPTGRATPNLDLRKIIDDPSFSRPVIEAMSTAISALRTGPAIYFGVGKMGSELAKLLAFWDKQQFVSIGHGGIFEGDDVINVYHNISTGNFAGNDVNAELHANSLREAISRTYPNGLSGPISAIVIDDRIIFGHTMIGVVKLLQSEELRNAIGADIRIDGFAFIAERLEGRKNLIDTCGVNDNQIKALVRYKAGPNPSSPLEPDFAKMAAHHRFPDLFGRSISHRRPHESPFRSRPSLVI